MYQVVVSKKAQKDLKKINNRDRTRLNLAMLSLRKDPFTGKKLEGKLDDCYSLRVWPYRIIYLLEKQKLLVLIVRIGHRQGVYK